MSIHITERYSNKHVESLLKLLKSYQKIIDEKIEIHCDDCNCPDPWIQESEDLIEELSTRDFSECKETLTQTGELNNGK
tara:strand:- start:986 stop:1222 length:237 start_codon:yes stop_codon:yes gene_type:complete